MFFYCSFCESSSAGRASRCQREGRRFKSDLSLKEPLFRGFYLWRRTQVVRERFAKPSCTSSNLVDASTRVYTVLLITNLTCYMLFYTKENGNPRAEMVELVDTRDLKSLGSIEHKPQ